MKDEKQDKRKLCITATVSLLLIIAIYLIVLPVGEVLAINEIPVEWRKIFVSSVSGDDTDSGTFAAPVATLTKAKEIAQGSGASGFAILLKGGENFTPSSPMVNQDLLDYWNFGHNCAFIWDIDKPLLISTYGNDELAVLGPGTAISTTDPCSVDPNSLSRAFAVCTPCKQNVTIENIHMYHWELGAVCPYKYQPAEPDKKLIIRNNVMEEVGTEYFPEEVFLRANGDLVYAGYIVGPRESSNIEITGNILKNGNNQFDDYHTTPYLMDSFHAFYVNSSSKVEIANNIIANSGGPPLKAKHPSAYNIYAHMNAFYYTSPSIQIDTVQEGFVRCMSDAQIEVGDNYFYCPFVWPAHENPATAVASQGSGNSAANIVWGINDFVFPYFNPPGGPYFTTVTKKGDYTGSFSKRYYDGSANEFVYLDIPNWSPSTAALAPYALSDTPVVAGLLDEYMTSTYYLTDGAFVDSHQGWNLEAIVYMDNNGNILAYGSSNDENYTGWVMLEGNVEWHNRASVAFVEDFDKPDCLNEWILSYSNTSSSGVSYDIDSGGDSRLEPIFKRLW